MVDWNKVKKGFYWVFGSIVVGALGSGFWEAVLGPILSNLSNWFIDMLIKISQSYSNGVYINISKGFHEGPSLMAVTHLQLIVMMVFIFMSLEIISNRKKLFDLVKGNKSSRSEEDIKKGLIFKFAMSKYHNIVIILITMVMVCSIIFSSIEESYVNDKITEFNQLKVVVAPFIDVQERLLLDSNFAQIKTKKEYDSLMIKMMEVVEKHKLNYSGYPIYC